MPLFRDPDRQRQYIRSNDHDELEKAIQESSRTQIDLENHYSVDNTEHSATSRLSSSSDLSPIMSWARTDRQEMIQRIKESSPWRLEIRPQRNSGDSSYMSHDSLRAATQTERDEDEDSTFRDHIYKQSFEELGSPADIQRPRSALHSGDFREIVPQHAPDSPRPRFAQPSLSSPLPQLGTSPTTPWFGAPVFSTHTQRPILSSDYRDSTVALQTRTRAPSLGSFSSSYVLKAPTSPLVHQANNTDLDFSPRENSRDFLEPTERANRRRTLPPESFSHLQSSPPGVKAVNIRTPFSPRREDLFFHSQHSPRRSLNSAYSLQLASTGNNTIYGARRLSLASEAPHKSHAPMVGSYEESILHGRMSMNPSKPLDFTAQIGVLGKGKCKGNLKCPPHVSVPFPAVFYHYPTSGNGRSISDDSPSPYVGQIDLENSLSKNDFSSTPRRKRKVSLTKGSENKAADDSGLAQVPDSDTRRRREKKNRGAESPKCPPGGCYRIPQQGQLQIIIKNPHKTAVKLFLVPYDIGDMKPGTKTFIRQRSYSAGPVVDMPLSARRNYGTDRPEASLNATEDPRNKPTLRYLVHLNICCPSRGRFYLHSTIRVVFANRVPDGKEKLRNEIQLPEPRYSPYKPTREPALSSSANARLAIENATRRRSTCQSPITHLRPHVTAPDDKNIPMHWNAVNFPGSYPDSHQSDESFYSKLNKGDAGYGGYLYHSGQSGPETGESLLARRLRHLGVHKQESFDN
ncbi:hypothetical protein N7495_002524 [Penicillium taxi]|uniref:uncharacterized protein n=1 Tax=Penicillium taxi TaxID=168475 RepID=UPI002544FF67|nr:uncharacterized protein N7495_002524 [Penicillium taxi]KAJ5901996.1 hypothetical protein N7495_002524 [Penicillium taxi]